MFSRVKQRTHNINNEKKNNVPMLFDFTKQNKVHVKKNITLIPPKTNIVNSTPNTMSWGKPIWIFLHSVAANVNDDNFNLFKYEILQMIYMICTNLPCPTCSQHAQRYLSSVNFNSINSKQKLIEQLYLFHNSVNVRKNQPLYSESGLSKYNNVNIHNVILDFFKAFSGTGSKLNIHSFDKQKTIQYVKNCMNKKLF